MSVGAPYYKGEVLALCVERPLVGLIIGGVPGARGRGGPGVGWVPAFAVKTRAQAKIEGVAGGFGTPSVVDRAITPAQVSRA